MISWEIDNYVKQLVEEMSQDLRKEMCLVKVGLCGFTDGNFLLTLPCTHPAEGQHRKYRKYALHPDEQP